MIVVTGAAGFIGSCLIRELNNHNFNRIIAVDIFDNPKKTPNVADKTIWLKVDRRQFFEWLDENGEGIEFIFHLGARTDTSEKDKRLLQELNTDYSKNIWHKCVQFQIPLIYASSAATYGNGEQGYDDEEENLPCLKPLNEYAISKNNFDLWAFNQPEKPFFYAGLKFFNVYGPNEYHKHRMASVIFHACNHILSSGKMRLFRSHRKDLEDGEQMRDFVYVKDVVKVMYWFMHHRKDSGVYNLGTGRAETFLSLADGVFQAMGLTPQIEFTDTPPDIRENYQYFTQANMTKLRSVGYDQKFYSLKEGIDDYVKNYLCHTKSPYRYF